MPDNGTSRLDRIEANLEKLTSVVDTLANTVVAHDNDIDQLLVIVERQAANAAARDKQIDALVQVAERHQRDMEEFRRQMVETERRWQAYLNTLPKH